MKIDKLAWGFEDMGQVLKSAFETDFFPFKEWKWCSHALNIQLNAENWARNYSTHDR